MRGHNRVKNFYCTSVSMGKVFENLFKKPLSQNSSDLLAK
jgi:hypothetical protein